MVTPCGNLLVSYGFPTAQETDLIGINLCIHLFWVAEDLGQPFMFTFIHVSNLKCLINFIPNLSVVLGKPRVPRENTCTHGEPMQPL